MKTATKIELPEILIVRSVPIDVPNIQHRNVIRETPFYELMEYAIYCKHICELTAGRDLRETIKYDGGWIFPSDRQEEINEWCKENHDELASEINNFLAKDLANHLNLDEEGESEICDPEFYESQYTVHKDGYYKLKEDNDRKILELNFEKGFNNKLKVDPLGLERSIGSN